MYSINLNIYLCTSQKFIYSACYLAIYLFTYLFISYEERPKNIS